MKNEIDVVFMCGGYGTRMGEVANSTQKCMLPFQEKPLLQHTLEAATKAFGRFNPILAVSYRADEIIDHFGKRWNKDEIIYVQDPGGVEDKGVIYSVEDHLQGGPFMLIHGNIIFDSEVLKQAVEMHESIQPITVWSVAEKVQESNHSVLSVDEDGLITDWMFPPPDPIPEGYYRDMGIYIFDTSLYQRLAVNPHHEEKYIMGVCIKMCGEDDKLAAVVYSGEWIHFEKPEDFKRTDWHL